jgi:hypothetical protein
VYRVFQEDSAIFGRKILRLNYSSITEYTHILSQMFMGTMAKYVLKMKEFTITVMRDVRCLARGQGRVLLGLPVT